MRHYLASDREPAGEADDQAAERIDLLGDLGVGQLDTGGSLEVVEIDPRLGHENAGSFLGPELALVFVVLVGDGADDLLQRSSMVTRPSTPPYSSMTSAMWMRAVCIFCSSTPIGIDGGA